MTKKLIVCRGIPASGKSTWANEQVLTNNAKVLNKDSIREELGITEKNWNKSLEVGVVKKERERAEELMKSKFPYIIIDNTHLGKFNKHISFYKELAEKYDYEFEIKDFFITRQEAIERDNKRAKSVGVDVINKMIKMQGNGGYPHNPSFKKIEQGLPTAYIVDIDGTLAFMDDKRSPYDYEKAIGDRVNPFLHGLLAKLIEDNVIIILSGRDGECEDVTRKWLQENIVPHDYLYMRKPGDKRKDSIVKRELYDEYIAGKYNIMGVFDDRNQVCDMWRLDLKLPCFQVWYGYF